MIIVRLMGGMGNQMFQYAVGRSLAERRQTELKLDLTFLLNRLSRKNFIFRDYDLGIFNITEGSAQHYRSPEDFESVLTKLGFKNVRILRIKKIDPAPHVIIKGEKKYERNK